MSRILCKYCYNEIEDRDRLVVGSKWFQIKPFHYVCFQEIEQETEVAWNSWTPINGPAGTITFLLMLALSVWMLTTNTFGSRGKIVGIIALYPIILRLVSFFFIELRLPKLK
ncbi:hypothetical protein NC797_08940 [Aquibacillus sp. 3ASR75-11]|uniref:Uncharacterized protein n=1 Tax=Terrihalobacillus insolitus TaxID=2950438 RepID=A0A9X3WWD4_9BACI|nr:hypothetical protein [Terrihalobacillus insolitus]MDC3413609.1 hypothetical protein [Terrihalobacillus insolitus]MDC3424634.1 hypothetical protein [Terrihalobacillus insolitus]